MRSKKIEDLNEEEFRGMLSYMASEEFDEMTVNEFFDVLDEMEETDEAEIVELTAHIEEGQLVLEQPAPVPVVGNEIRLGDKKPSFLGKTRFLILGKGE